MPRSFVSARDQAMTNAWLREALDVAVPGPPRRPNSHGAPGYGQQPGLHTPAAEDAPWMANDWRGASDGGSFRSSVRPPMPSDIPHPSEAGLHPKRNAALIANAQATEDPENDPWGVLNGTGHTFEDLVNNHVSHHLNQTPDQDYAGRVWYRAAHDLTKDVAQKTHGDHSRVVSTFSAFSPRKAWDENIEHGTHFAANYDGSDPSFTMPTLQDQVEKAKAIYHGEDPNKVLGGPKTKAFYSNIMDHADFRAPRPGVEDDSGYYDHPTNPHSGEADWRMHPDQATTVDTHHARLQTTPHGADLTNAVYATPEHFDKFNGMSVGGKPMDLAYDLHSRASWEATRRINEMQQDEGKHQTPKQTQAGPWGKFKADVDAAGRGAGSVAPGERPKGLQNTIDMKKNRGRDPQEVEREWGGKNPLNKPIPRYQQDPDDWQDLRRPDVTPSADWKHKRNLPPRQYASIHTALIHGGVWDQHLASWIAAHPREQAPEHQQVFDAHMAAFNGGYIEEGPHDSPFRGEAADDLWRGCKYCGAGPQEMHDAGCPTNHSDDPEMDFRALGQRPPMKADPMIHLNGVQDTLAWVDGLLA